ncbi:MAG: methyltransferase domain-containing protein, partial [Planctomycetota bacterium]
MPWLAERSTETEILDGGDVPVGRRRRAVALLPRVNRWLGGARALRLALELLRRRLPTDRPVRVADVGCGVGDQGRVVVRWGERRGLKVHVLGVDVDPVALRLAPGPLRARADALRLPLRDRAVDVVMANLFLHHFERAGLTTLLGELVRAAAVGVLVTDLHRHPLALAGWWLWSALFLGDEIVRRDGHVSVRRG